MATEIERKFLVISDGWKKGNPPGCFYRQGYLSADLHSVIRVRTSAGRGWITIKKKKGNLARWEYEYEIPLNDAREMMDELCRKPLIEKVRYRIICKDRTWEIDVFSGANQGLVVAEIELDAEDGIFAKPPWLGEEVTHDPRYLNVNLALHPFCRWE
ncbi:MAG: CYTH domain-containing protein [Syntrophobacterales bacterium]|jgi:adenylate cyclase|nr:CYTH domain-containing protein [Syntrophobacterales bacterium]